MFYIAFSVTCQLKRFVCVGTKLEESIFKNNNDEIISTVTT